MDSGSGDRETVRGETMDNEPSLDLRKFIETREGKPILCASCGFEYVHLGPVHVRSGTHSFDIGDNLTIEKHDDVPCGRGSVVTIDLWCESGHRFELELAFHKGMTYVSSRAVGEYDLKGKDAPAELWRD